MKGGKEMIISRDDEANFPDFNSIDEARDYFEDRYGDKYNFGQRERQEGSATDFWGEYVYYDDVDGQPVQIGQNGHVHVVY